MVFNCSTCGTQEKMIFDASLVEERTFEGVWFNILPDENSPMGYEVKGQDRDARYLERFNMKKHLKSAREIIDEDSMGIYCPKCEEEQGEF